MSRLGKSAFQQLIKEDIEWLKNATPEDNSLEKMHILEILDEIPDILYGNHSFIDQNK